MEAVAPPVAERTQDKVIKRQYKPRRDWAKVGLSVYFVIFLIFLYAPMILMAILSFQGYYGGVTFPFKGPVSLQWWRSIFQEQVGNQFTNAGAIRAAGERSLWVSLAAGAIVALLAFSLSMAFRRRFRGDGLAFYIIMLALMTPGFLLGLGTQIFWKAMGQETSLWHTALGANTVWGIPFGFLVMVAIWNRYDDHIDEAARDLGANAARTFGEVTLPLVWTGLFGAFLFGFTLTWNDFDRTVLLVLDNTLPLQIVGLIQAAALRPDLYALGTATTLVSIAVIFSFLAVIAIRSKFRRTPVQSVEEELGLGGGIDVVVDNIPQWLATHTLPPTAYAVIVTRGHTHDLDALRALTAAPLRYLGLIGSKAKVRRIFDALVEEGTPPQSLQGVHAPIGLDIGAITPQEIAVSIVAQLIAAKHGKISDPHIAAVSMRWEGALRK